MKTVMVRGWGRWLGGGPSAWCREEGDHFVTCRRTRHRSRQVSTAFSRTRSPTKLAISLAEMTVEVLHALVEAVVKPVKGSFPRTWFNSVSWSRSLKTFHFNRGGNL